MTYTVQIIHPTPAADFTMTIAAKSLGHAHAKAYRQINDKFGADTLYMVGDISSK